MANTGESDVRGTYDVLVVTTRARMIAATATACARLLLLLSGMSPFLP